MEARSNGAKLRIRRAKDLPRIDTVYVLAGYSGQAIAPGVPATNPQPPKLPYGAIPVANIRVAPQPDQRWWNRRPSAVHVKPGRAEDN